MKLLIAEDERSYRILLRKYAERLDHDVQTVESGTEAWEAMGREHFDVLVCDWMMPGFSGVELSRRLRERPPHAGYTYVIVITAHEGQDRMVEAMAAGADDFLVKPIDLISFTARLIAAERVTAIHGELAAKSDELERVVAALEETTRIDTLTRLGNRLRLEEDLVSVAADVDRYDRPHCLGMCDVDNFKAYNDTYGHRAGDRCLVEVANALIRGTRNGDRIYRYGGEEFLVLFPIGDANGAVLAMERLRKSIASLGLEHTGSASGVVTISGGVARVLPSAERRVEQTIEAADRALYAAKEEGRNRVVVDPDSIE